MTEFCNRCGVQLIPGYAKDGGNWPPSKQRNYDYQCSSCFRKYLKTCYNGNWREAQNGYEAKRRARKAIGGPVEDIDRRAVWGRDEGRCRVKLLCNGAFVPFTEMQLDHVVPLAKGGTHTWANVQTACLICNAAKKDRLLKDRR